MAAATSTCPVCRAAVPAGATVCDVCGLVLGSTTTAQVITPVPVNPVTPPLQPGQILDGGNYIVDRPLSKGGMGALYLAHDKRAFDRPVVIKTMIDYFDISDPNEVQLARERFIEEARTLSRVKHPNFPQIFAHFVDGSQTCIVMEYIEGKDLGLSLSRIDERTGKQVRGKPFPVEQVIDWGIDVCRMLEHLATHKPPIIHHDIKPNNLVLDSHSGEIFLVDFGTAKVHLLTSRAGSGSAAFGTPGYAPPEQYRGLSEPRSDMYALAATLYHLATDDDPAEHPFKFPRLDQLGRFGELLAPALEREVTLRPTASELRHDLLQLREPAVVAVPTPPPAPPPPSITTRPASNPSTPSGRTIIVVFGITLLALILIVGFFSVPEAQQTSDGPAILPPATATLARPATEAPLVTATPRRNPTAQSNPTTSSGSGPTVLIPTLALAPALPPGARWRARGTNSQINALAFDQTGEALISGGELGFLELWQANEGGPLLTLRGDLDDLTAISFAPDGNLIGGGSEGLVQIWPLDTSDFELITVSEAPITAVAMGTTGYLAVGLSSGDIRLYDERRVTGRLLRTGCDATIHQVLFDQSGSRVGILDGTGCITVWSIPSLEVLEVERYNLITRLSDLAFASNEQVVIAQVNTSLNLTSLQGGESQTVVITDFTSTITTLALSNDGNYLAVGYNDGTIEVFTTTDPVMIKRFQLPEGLPITLEFAPDNGLLASGDNNGYLTIWELP